MSAIVAAALPELERVISDGLRTFVEVGAALARIRDEKLYSPDHKTFEAYVHARFDMKRRYAHYVITAAGVVHNCAQAGLSPPTNEAQTRELAKLLKPIDQAQAWKEAVATTPKGVEVTAKRVAAVVKRLPARLKRQHDKRPSAMRQHQDLKLHAHAAKQQRLIEQRNAVPEFASFRQMQQAISQALPSRAQRMLEFILDGGELSLIRLGLDWAVTADTLQKAYREKSRTAHPDAGGSAAAFIELTRDRDLVQTLLGGTT